MLAKVIKNQTLKCNRLQSFRTRIHYICGKANMVETVNIAGTWYNACDQMQFCAGLNDRLRTPVCHIVISWSETETPTDAEMIDAAKMVLHDFDAEEYQAVLAVHRDRPSGHVHIVLNRVHPVTGEALSLSNDYQRLERACRRVEDHMGWPADRGRFDVEIIDGEVELCPKPPEHWERKTQERARGIRPDSRSVRVHQLRTNKGFLRDTLSDEILSQVRSILDNAHSWQAVQRRLASIDLDYLRVRSGARIRQISTGLFMAASQLGSRFAWRKMKARLGSKPLFIEYSATKTNAWITETQTNLKYLKDRQQVEQLTVRKTLNGMRAPEAQALRAVMQEIHAGQRRKMTDAQDASYAPQPRSTPTPPKKVSERYRHATRLRAQDVPILDDHTTRRQDWMLSPHIDDPNVIPIIEELTRSWPHAMRTDGNGGLLFAKRNAEDKILGFERLSLISRVDEDAPTSLHNGLCIFGPTDAGTCIIARTPCDAVGQMLKSDNREPLVIVTGTVFNTDTVMHLQQVLMGRENISVVATGSDAEEYLDTLENVLPQSASVHTNLEPDDIPDLNRSEHDTEHDDDLAS